MTNAQAGPAGILARLLDYLPATIDRRVRVVAWASLACQLLLVGTGGLVRLTGSGLGCPTWPQCSAGSFVTTPEMGLHGVIEFGNRLLTFVLVIVVIAAFLAVFRMRRVRRDLFWLTFIQGMSIPFQAVLGGISVLAKLNPYVVGSHFIVSMVLVRITATLVYRVYNGPRGDSPATPRWHAAVTRVAAVFVAITVVLGILTTGAGPHAGDANTHRNGFDPKTIEVLHAVPAFAVFALTLVLVAGAFRLGLQHRFVLMLLGVEVAQIIVGLVQANTGLPAFLVGAHLVLAGLLVAAMTAVTHTLENDADLAKPVPEAAVSATA
ncbi:cytochrome c oxidase assembly protein subunit 15 [Frondihabitans sp. PhB188]|uniref:COX15/CtaA family protein n=1 Tax=Frondihabitans sp. PhB188 TaxID=2485200 RepID=UPI000FB86EE8|nr:COX15/CtaA family protein [Frondihabitans sp. PhB188]ROQ40982.1 cytochrome c oxidase assembly protein subunit 15 [Frondihabitans sp. PhB188]